MTTQAVLQFHSKIPPLLFEIHTTLQKEGFQSYIVGGAVRDLLLDRDILDWDMNTDAPPQHMQRMFPYAIPTGIKHGTITIKKGPCSCELTSFRIDGTYSDKRRPDRVNYNAKLIDDLSRRDFTMNAMVYDFDTRSIIDPFEGQSAIQTRKIRCVGKPELRVSEDYLRILRAIRFSSQLAFHIEEDLLRCILNFASRIDTISSERITMELGKLITTAFAFHGLQYLAVSDMLRYIFHDPVLCLSKEIGYRIGEGLSYAWKRQGNEMLQWALLFLLFYRYTRHLHPRYCLRNEYRLRHCLNQVRLSNRENKNIRKMVNAVHFVPTASWSDVHMRFYFAYTQITDPYLLVTALETCHAEFPRIKTRFLKAIDSFVPRSKLAINGNTLITQLNCREGKLIGRLLKRLYRHILHYPENNTSKKLLAIAQSFYDKN